ncbi:EF-hand domain-containing protein [Tahibacter sp.]|uniref:EF-hand domain-containing protein n=1 Tax=Tahibacter sp. TaxID=2056211 RepID=UPI0028C47682|nr:EF-hand domain-containing protein [Tahibacter sp.]
MGYRRVVRGMSSALLLAGLFATTAYAADTPGDSRSRLLQRMDRSGDGKISFEEYRNAMLRRFDARDKNHDGVLDGAEFPKEWLAGAATEDAQHKISRDDFSDQLAPTFDRFDADKDGQLAGAELDAFAAARKAREETKP